ncbi:MAG: hypothetical protein M2R45_03739 [Verrucomicrobia subdivision 3 bacterium]|nr:hypothetical protein [Limisphaerales bacterium]MCS1416938.1 hypothetical protein [Limisphaerales bacterium]
MGHSQFTQLVLEPSALHELQIRVAVDGLSKSLLTVGSMLGHGVGNLTARVLIMIPFLHPLAHRWRGRLPFRRLFSLVSLQLSAKLLMPGEALGIHDGVSEFLKLLIVSQ